LILFAYQEDNAVKSKLLTATAIEGLTKPGTYRDSRGLYLKVGPTGGKSWVYRYSLGRAHNMGLGSWPEMSLAGARKLAESMYEKRQQDLDPLAERRKARAALKKAKTFGQVAESWFTRRAKDVSAEDARAVESLIRRTCKGIWNTPAKDIDKAAVVSVLTPMFDAGKTVTGKRLAMYLSGILAHAVFKGARPEGSNPSTWKGFLDQHFTAPKARDVQRHPALPHEQAPGFAAELRQRDGVGFRALELLLLTATRAKDVRFMKWDHVDVPRRVWTVPKTKNEKKLDVYLSDRAAEILNSLPRRGAFVFAGSRDDAPINESEIGRSMAKLRDPAVAVPHGCRSTFRDWAESRGFRFEAIELSLDHSFGTAVERTYRRDNLPMERVKLLTEWSEYLSKPLASADVVPLRRA